MVRSRLRPVLLLIGILTTAALVVACSGGAEPSSASGAKPAEVRVTLSDFKIEIPVSSFSAGVPYQFVVINRGQAPHEFMVLPPVHGGMAMEEMDRMALAMVEEEALPPGGTYALALTFPRAFPAGELEFACHVPGHYEAGMKLAITVK